MLFPPGREDQKSSKLAIRFGAFTLGSVGAGVAMALALGALGNVVSLVAPSLRFGGLAGVSAAAVFLELSGRKLSKRSVKRRGVLIPRSRLKNSMILGPMAFGAELGLGFRTAIPRFGPFVVVALLTLGHRGLSFAAAAGLGWGLGRSLVLPSKLVWERVRRRKPGATPSFDAFVAITAGAASVSVASLMFVTAVAWLLTS